MKIWCSHEEVMLWMHEKIKQLKFRTEIESQILAEVAILDTPILQKALEVDDAFGMTLSHPGDLGCYLQGTEVEKWTKKDDPHSVRRDRVS